MTGRTPRMTPRPRHECRRALTSYCRPKPEATQRDWQSCGRRWPGISARQFPRRSRSKGNARRRRTSEISIVTINGNLWTTHAEWMAQMGPQHLVLGQGHRLDTGRCDEEAAKLHTGEAQRAEGENGFIPGNVGGYVCCSAQALGTGVGLAST